MTTTLLNIQALQLKEICLKVSSDISNLVPYSPGKPIAETQPEYGLNQVIKLASNENPLGISERVTEAVMRAVKEIHRYPDASFFEATTAVCKLYGVDRSQLTFTNGS